MLCRHLGEPPGRCRHDPPKGVGHTARLLLHQHLLECREAGSPDLLGDVDRGETKLPRLLVVQSNNFGRQLAAVELGLDLVRDEVFVDERSGLRLYG